RRRRAAVNAEIDHQPKLLRMHPDIRAGGHVGGTAGAKHAARGSQGRLDVIAAYQEDVGRPYGVGLAEKLRDFPRILKALLAVVGVDGLEPYVPSLGFLVAARSSASSGRGGDSRERPR